MKALSVLVALGLLTAPALAVPAVSPNEGGLNPAQAARLLTFGPKVVIPSYVPRGYHLSKVEVQTRRKLETSASLVYKAAGGSEFTVQEAMGGIGDGGDGDKSYPFVSPVFGNGTLLATKARGGRKESCWSGWVTEKKKGPPYFSVTASGLPASQAVKVVESLRFMSH